jgi:hypothetical protein
MRNQDTNRQKRNPARKQIVGLKRPDPARWDQSQRPGIGHQPNSMKTITEKTFNRNRRAVLDSSRHTSLIIDSSRPLSPIRPSFPFWNSSHAGGRTRPNSMKTQPHIFSTRHTHAICAHRVTCPPKIESPSSDFENLRPAGIITGAIDNANAGEEGAWLQQ